MYVRIEPSRELDGLTAPHLQRQLLLVPAQADVVIDMSGVTFCDSTGIGAIITGLNHRAGATGTMTIRNPTQPVRRLLDLCGVDQLVPIESDDQLHDLRSDLRTEVALPDLVLPEARTA